ncbi:N-acetyltransferase family protein [Flexivirga sp. B27]
MTEELHGIRIERAAPDDAFVLAAMTLRWDLEGGSPRRDGFIDEFAEAWLAQGSARPAWLAKRADGDPVGFVIGVLATSLPSLRRPAGGWLHLSSFYVVPELRGHGLGRLMMREVLAWATECGLHRLQLNATDDARAFYRSAGFGGPQDTLMQLVLSDRLPAT